MAADSRGCDSKVAPAEEAALQRRADSSTRRRYAGRSLANNGGHLNGDPPDPALSAAYSSAMPVRVGFLGAGLIATFHSKMLRASGEDVAWAGVWDPEERRREAFAQASGADVCSSEEAVLDGCDAVYVCTWTGEHPRLVAAACERGLPVFCEKPLGVDLRTAEAMASMVQKAGVTNQVGLILRYSPAFNLVKSLVDDPASGRLMSLVYRDDQFIPVQGHYGSTWRGERDKAGSGALLEHSIHDLDIIEHCLGSVASVSARSANFHGLDGIEDSVAAVLSFDNGAVGALTSVWHDILERPSLRRVEIFCEHLYIGLEDDWSGPVWWTCAGEPDRQLAGEELDDECRARGVFLGNADGAFIRAVQGREPAWPSFADAVRPHALADAIYQSADAGGDAVQLRTHDAGAGR
jgi:myo-inositol 2-dehydrogenase/D-chiro-inositol 1-dehydrogenase